MKPRTLTPAWLWRLWLASLVVVLLIWLLLRGAWIYVRRGEEALEEWSDDWMRDPMRAPTSQGGANHG